MFGIVLLALTVLAGLAFDWISFSTSPGRIVVSVNFGKLAPAIRGLKNAALGLTRRSNSFSQRKSHH